MTGVLRDSVIVSAVRLPTGKFLGSLKRFSAPQLGALAIHEAVQRAGIDMSEVDECILGNVISAGLGQNPARQAALGAGLPDSVAALTINKVCGSGLKAVMLASQGISTGDADVVVAGGMESMTQTPYLLKRMREGVRLGNHTLMDSMIHDGLWCALENCHMGITGEEISKRYGITREEQDAYALESHRKAAAATSEGWFTDEILTVDLTGKNTESTKLTVDESIRHDASSSTLAKLKPAFIEEGTVTAGNAPGVNDGAAAVVVMSATGATALNLEPMARIVAQGVSGVPPLSVMMSPVEAVRKVAKKAGWALTDVDLFELNEAFSVQSIAIIRELDLDPNRVNIHGGAIALGHPIGASGARVLTTLLYAMKLRNVRRGIASLCLGGGNGVALAVERELAD
ncbi:MAG TPA: acetyl-CoA C-acetyltransferase [Vicinamibacterales bacterium]|nr:acetyl-CoA C-acetyltransferase [Vicinamibacterales bacterium]|tara:strand:- start:12162 stop:13364 length:1203 start_codon:yes stop_codon:yes gene_type:complete